MSASSHRRGAGVCDPSSPFAQYMNVRVPSSYRSDQVAKSDVSIRRKQPPHLSRPSTTPSLASSSFRLQHSEGQGDGTSVSRTSQRQGVSPSSIFRLGDSPSISHSSASMLRGCEFLSMSRPSTHHGPASNDYSPSVVAVSARADYVPPQSAPDVMGTFQRAAGKNSTAAVSSSSFSSSSKTATSRLQMWSASAIANQFASLPLFVAYPLPSPASSAISGAPCSSRAGPDRPAGTGTVRKRRVNKKEGEAHTTTTIAALASAPVSVVAPATTSQIQGTYMKQPSEYGLVQKI